MMNVQWQRSSTACTVRLMWHYLCQLRTPGSFNAWQQTGKKTVVVSNDFGPDELQPKARVEFFLDSF